MELNKVFLNLFLLFCFFVGFNISFASTSINDNDINIASSGTTLEFSISGVTVVDDRNFIVYFTSDLAKEPLNLEIMDENNNTIYVDTVKVGTGEIEKTINYDTGTRMDVYVYTASKLDINKKYFIIIKDARSMDGQIIKQDKKEIMLDNAKQEEQKIVTDDNLAKSTSTLKTEELQNSNQIKSDLEKLTKQSVSENALKLNSAPVSDVNVISGGKLNTNNIKRLPKTGPESIFIVILSLIIPGIYFLKKRNI